MFNAFNLDFLIRLAIEVVATLLLVLGCYYPSSRQRDHATSFILFGVGVFLVTYLLHSVDMTMGFAFGLFAVFSMLRYRTESISIKEMTYLFLVITLALLSAVGPVNTLELVLINLAICVTAYFSESSYLLPQLTEKTVHYEKIENIKPENCELLLADLKIRTGIIDIERVEVVIIDFLHDSAELKIFYPKVR